MTLQRNLFFMLLFLAQYANAFFKMEIPQGFLWYREAPRIKKGEKKEFNKKTPQANSERNKHEALKIAFEEALHTALDNPTIENVKHVQLLQKQIVDKADAFSKAWMVASMDFDGVQDPDLSANPLYLKLKEKERSEKREKLFGKLSKTYGVFYLFDEGCPYCHHFFPVVQKFCNSYGFEMIAVSRQGSTLPIQGETSKITFLKDNGMMRRLNTKGVLPAVFLANLKQESVIPLSWGMSTLTELEENLERVMIYNQQGEY